MKKQLTKLFVPILVALLVTTSLVALPTNVSGQNSLKDETMDFIKNVLSVDTSIYTIEYKGEHTFDNMPLTTVDRTITYLDYTLSSKDNDIDISFRVEKGTIAGCDISPIPAQIITTKQYNNPLAAAQGFLEKYQTFTKSDLNNLRTMLDNVDTTKDTTITTENTKLEIKHAFLGVDQTIFVWSQIINGADYAYLELAFDKDGNFITMIDSRTIFTIGDTSINISKDQAIAIALEDLQFYSYEMSDGSIVKNFKVNKANIDATLVTFTGGYELRPYWDVRMYLDEVYPGNVQGISAFIWANTGEIIGYGNMAFGGTYTTDNDNEPNSNMLFIGAIIIAIIAIATTGVLMVRKKRK